MALRLIEMVVQKADSENILELLNGHVVLEHRHLQLPDGEVLVRILVEAERTEGILDLLAQSYTAKESYRVVVLPVEATLPRAEPDPEPPEKTEPTAEEPEPEEKAPGRIAREELYEDIKDAAQLTRAFLAMTALSTVVAGMGLHSGNVAIIIGAMVIAPLLGPNMAFALATTLGDLKLLRKAAQTTLAGIGTAMVLGVILGAVLQIDPASHEIASRNAVSLGDVVVALASGAAGALAFTTGVSAILIGVMVAVALLPTLVTIGLLLGGGHPALAMGSLALFLINLICVNLAGVSTFMLQGIRPATWWEKDRAAKATRISVAIWVVLLAALGGLILWLQKS